MRAFLALSTLALLAAPAVAPPAPCRRADLAQRHGDRHAAGQPCRLFRRGAAALRGWSRRGSGQLILRPAIGWKFSDAVTAYGGYAHVEQPIEGGRDRNEERLFTQLSWTLPKIGAGTLSSRTRLEHRRQSNGERHRLAAARDDPICPSARPAGADAPAGLGRGVRRPERYRLGRARRLRSVAQLHRRGDPAAGPIDDRGRLSEPDDQRSGRHAAG